MTLGQVLVELRKEKKVSLAQVKRAIGVSPSQLSLMENDEGKPSVSQLMKLAEYYDTTIYDIFREMSGYQSDRGVFDTLVNWMATPNEPTIKRWTHTKLRRLHNIRASQGIL